jgi:hypothetical protein
MKNLKLKLFFAFCLLFFAFNYCQAAILYLEPTEGSYYYSDSFIVKIKVDNEGECINAVMADLTFEKDILEIKDFSKGNSILSFWIEEPQFSNRDGRLSFTGGVPGGYCGVLPGDPGESNLLGKIVFEVKSKESGTTKLRFLDTSQVLLNDGLGTPAKLFREGANFNILSGVPEITRREWQIELERDKTPPESFKINITQDSSIFEGKHFVAFSTLDKQTGIDYYEVKEGKGKWEKASSPYLLKDQNLEGIIKVKAVDKAGNERIVEYGPEEKLEPFSFLILLLILIVVVVVWRFFRKYFLCKKSSS